MLVDDFIVVIGACCKHSIIFIATGSIRPLALGFAVFRIRCSPFDLHGNRLVQLFVAGGGQDLGDGVSALF